MAIDTSILQGQLVEDPSVDQKDIQRLLSAFLDALIEEENFQNPAHRNEDLE